MHHQQQSHHSANGLRDRSSESPLDFSSATNGSYGNWQDDVSAMMIGGDDEMKHFSSIGNNSAVKRGSASSPDYR
jgi:hypothetical protein